MAPSPFLVFTVHGAALRWHAFQFTVRQALLAMTFVGLFLAPLAWAGVFGLGISALLSGIVAIAYGEIKRDRHWYIPGVVLLMIAFAMIGAGSVVALGSGRKALPCRFAILDANSNQPIASAHLRIRNVSTEGVPLTPIPAGEPGANGVTNTQGLATILFTFPTGSRTNAFIDEAHIYVPPHFWLQVEASGYERHLIRLDSLSGGSYDLHKLPLPEMSVRLKRP